MQIFTKIGAISVFLFSLSSANGQELIQLTNFGELKAFKRGKNYEIGWTGGVSSDVLTFQLLKNGEKVREWENVDNVGSHKFVFPASLRPGKDYALVVLARDKLLFKSRTFSITRRIPLAVKVSPLVVTGIILVLAAPKRESEKLQLPSQPDVQ